MTPSKILNPQMSLLGKSLTFPHLGKFGFKTKVFSTNQVPGLPHQPQGAESGTHHGRLDTGSQWTGNHSAGKYMYHNIQYRAQDLKKILQVQS